MTFSLMVGGGSPGGGASGGLATGSRNYAEGHRERLRARYRLSGEAVLQDYELLELLLTYAIPGRDTKGLAKKLLERFGTLARALRIKAMW